MYRSNTVVNVRIPAEEARFNPFAFIVLNSVLLTKTAASITNTAEITASKVATVKIDGSAPALPRLIKVFVIVLIIIKTTVVIAMVMAPPPNNSLVFRFSSTVV